MKLPPEGRGMESVAGLKDRFPEKAIAVTMVGEARKFFVNALPSFLDLKFLCRDEHGDPQLRTSSNSPIKGGDDSYSS